MNIPSYNTEQDNSNKISTKRIPKWNRLLRPWRNRHKPHRLPPRSILKYACFIDSLLRSPNRGPLFLFPTSKKFFKILLFS